MRKAPLALVFHPAAVPTKGLVFWYQKKHAGARDTNTED